MQEPIDYVNSQRAFAEQPDLDDVPKVGPRNRQAFPKTTALDERIVLKRHSIIEEELRSKAPQMREGAGGDDPEERAPSRIE